jgi:hypothetical protein
MTATVVTTITAQSEFLDSLPIHTLVLTREWRMIMSFIPTIIELRILNTPTTLCLRRLFVIWLLHEEHGPS